MLTVIPKLKKLINQVVKELFSLGLSPAVLQQLLEQQNNANFTAEIQDMQEHGNLADISEDGHDAKRHATVVYELSGTPAHLEPRLRLSIKRPTDCAITTQDSIIQALLLHPKAPENNTALLNLSDSSAKYVRYITPSSSGDSDSSSHDFFIPLQSDTAFFQLLTTALASLSAHLNAVHGGFTSTLQSLAHTISATARPISSSTPHFSTYSMVVNNASTLRPSSGGRKTDLYLWREIFQMYLEGDIFESFGERTRGERSIEESEHRIKRFQERTLEKRSKFKLPGSKDALDVFMQMNFYILDLKRVRPISATNWHINLNIYLLSRSSNSRMQRRLAKF